MRALKDCSKDCTIPVMMLFTPVSIVLRSKIGSSPSELEIICKLNVEDAPLLKAAHRATTQAPIKMSIMGETLRGYMRALGVGSSVSTEDIQLDFHPTHGCLLRGGTSIFGAGDSSLSPLCPALASGKSLSKTLIDKTDLLEWHGKRLLSLVLSQADVMAFCHLAVAYSTFLSLYAESAQRYVSLFRYSKSLVVL